MEIKGKLDVDFLNLGFDTHVNESIERSDYIRVEGCWNIYFHGFMDAHDDIAYVKGKVKINPGIYEIVTYGIPALLFIWQWTNSDHPRVLKGLIVRADDIESINDAYVKYTENQMYV